MDGRPVKILDCSGNQRAEHLVQEWFARSMAVIVVYDMTRPDTLDAAIAMLPGLRVKVCFLGVYRTTVIETGFRVVLGAPVAAIKRAFRRFCM